MDPVYTISIIPTGAGAAGYTMPLPNRDEMFNTCLLYTSVQSMICGALLVLVYDGIRIFRIIGKRVKSLDTACLLYTSVPDSLQYY